MKYMSKLLLVIVIATTLSNNALAEPEEQVSWREQYAYSVGMAIPLHPALSLHVSA